MVCRGISVERLQGDRIDLWLHAARARGRLREWEEAREALECAVTSSHSRIKMVAKRIRADLWFFLDRTDSASLHPSLAEIARQIEGPEGR
jgi:hypothetical protein